MHLLPPLGVMFRALRRVPFALWLMIALFFMLAGAEQIAPTGEAKHFENVIIFYILFQVALLAYWRKRPPWMRATLNQGIAWFVGGFVVTVFILVGMGIVRGALGFETATYATTAPIYLMATHAIVVAFSEEAIFRGMLSHHTMLTAIPANIGFAIFHVWAYHGNVFSMCIAFVAGILFYIIMRKTNIFAAMGVHGGFNTWALGLWG